MDLVGHCIVAEQSGLFSEKQVYGPSIVELMYLNIAHCHDWAYLNCWEPEKYPKYLDTVQLFRAHMIGDWCIHYGMSPITKKQKKGWAYAKMKYANQLRDNFFRDAKQYGFVKLDLGAPSEWSRKLRLDFAHSLVEYSIELILAPLFINSDRFINIKNGLSKLLESSGYGSEEWVLNVFNELQIKSDQSLSTIKKSIADLGADSLEVSHPEEFAIRTAIRKYGLCMNKDSIDFVQTHLNSIANSLDKIEVLKLCSDISKLISNKHIRLFVPEVTSPNIPSM